MSRSSDIGLPAGTLLLDRLRLIIDRGIANMTDGDSEGRLTRPLLSSDLLFDIKGIHSAEGTVDDGED